MPKPSKPQEQKSSTEEKTNIADFLDVLNDLLAYFKSTQKGIEHANSRIVEKYPKFLSKQALFSLQLDDSVFRETFVTQILIFTKAIVDPIGMEQN